MKHQLYYERDKLSHLLQVPNSKRQAPNSKGKANTGCFLGLDAWGLMLGTFTRYVLIYPKHSIIIPAHVIMCGIMFFLPFLWKGQGVGCQDIHFSQFNQTPLALNPALTGAFNGDQRVILNHKDQWGRLAKNGPVYRTSMLSFDMGFFKSKWKSAYLGAGLLAFRDKAGDTQFGTTQINFSVSGIVSLNDKHKLSAGLQGGYAQRSIRAENMKWGSQYNFSTGKYDPDKTSDEAPVFEPYWFGDFSAGLLWNYAVEQSSLFANNQFKTNMGVGLFHINRPQQTPVTLQNLDKLYSKIVVHGGIQFGISHTNLQVIPSFMYFNQGAAQQLNLGAMARWTIKQESKYTGMFKETAFALGGYYRLNDAFIPSVLLEYGSFALGITYDVNTSELRTVSQGRGGIEFSLRYVNPNPFRLTQKSVRFL